MADDTDSVTATLPPPVDPGGDPLSSIIPMQQQPDYQTPQQPPQQPQTTPAHQDPEMVAGAVHQSWLGRILDNVGSILGGDTTAHVTKHPDGSIEVTHDPSTSGEKWGRIAAAALGGAAQGMAVGQGPGGPARAFAAGTGYGLQQPQEALDRANQEATVEQKRLQDHANLVFTQQKMVAQQLENKANNIKAGQAEIDQANDENERYQNAPNSQEVGTFGSIAEASKSPNAALILQHHPAGTLRSAPIYDKDGNMTGVRAYVVDRAWMDRLNDTPVTYQEQEASSDPNAPPTFKQVTIPANSDKNSKLDTFVQAKNANAAKIKADWAKAHPIPKTPAEARIAAGLETDPVKKQKLLDAATDLENTPAIKAQNAAHYATAAEASARAEQINRTIKGQPGGQPVEVEDPNYPSPTNFPVGTLGIAKPPKTGDYKIPAEAEGAYRLSKIMGESGDLIRRTATENPQLFGRLQGLLSQGKTIIGLSNSKDDQALATLAGSIQQYSQASAGFHRFRNKAAPAETEESSLNKFRNDPASIVAYLDSQKPALSQTEKLIKNYQVYGTPDGPSPEARAAAVSRAPNAAKFQQGGGAPQPQNPPGAAVQRPAGATMEYKDAQGNVTGWAVNGKYVAR
jgi:hypothetical protein